MEEIKKKFNIKYSASFDLNQNNNILLWFSEPCQSKYQVLSNYSFSQEQKSEYKDINGNVIHYFEIEGKNIVFNFSAELILKKISLDLKELTFDKIPNEIIDQYTKSERFLEQTAEIKKLTQIIIKDKENKLEKIKAIFEYVVNNFSYCYPVEKRGVVNLNLSKLQGDCAEYSSLFVAMCRIAGIPARDITGFVIFEENNIIQQHGWAQVYSDNFGWIDVDAQYASLEDDRKVGIKKYLFSRPEFRIEFTSGFNIPLKPVISETYTLKDINNLGLVTNRNVAQTLQPIVFASQKIVNFSDQIAYKQ